MTPEPRDAVGADVITTIPPTEPTFPKIADLIPARVRRWGYALSGAWATFVGGWVVQGNPPTWAGWVTIALTATGFGVAVSNVPKVVS